MCWFEICGKTSTSMLSLKTNYTAYLVFKLRRAHKFDDIPLKASVGTTGGGEVYERTFCLGLPAVKPSREKMDGLRLSWVIFSMREEKMMNYKLNLWDRRWWVEYCPHWCPQGWRDRDQAYNRLIKFVVYPYQKKYTKWHWCTVKIILC